MFADRMHIEDATTAAAVRASVHSSCSGCGAYCQHVWCQGHSLGDYEVAFMLRLLLLVSI